MTTRTIGRTLAKVFPLGLGAMPLSNVGRPAEKDSLDVIHAAIDAGVNFIDTANVYCENSDDLGHNERLIAKALSGNKEILVATKGGLSRTASGDWTLDGEPKKLRAACEKSLRNLDVEQIFLYQLHAPDASFPWQDQIAELARLQEEGKIRHIGISNVSAEEIKRAQEITRIETVQNMWNIASRSDEENGVFDCVRQFSMTYIAYCPVGGGHSHRELANNKDIIGIAKAYGASSYQVMLAWSLAKGDFMLPIPGASRRESIIDSTKSVALSLLTKDIELIDGIVASENS